MTLRFFYNILQHITCSKWGVVLPMFPCHAQEMKAQFVSGS